MPMFSPEFISEIRDKNDIVDVIEQYVKLKRAGSSLKGLCPFHNEKTPSFSVSPERQMFRCFGCGIGGDVFKFVMERENLDFVEAATMLAERARMDIPQASEGSSNYSKSAQEAAHEKTRLYYKINSVAARYFYDVLMSPEGQAAQQYLISRGLDNHTVNKFGIGYANPDSTALYTYMKNQGYSDEDLLGAKLIGRGDSGDIYDFFRGRIMFPIIDVRGNVIAFGGRDLSGNQRAKYLNSSETAVFNKSRNLFALNLAKTSKEPQMLVMEGYMDVVAMHQHGISNAVATLGTALTVEQAKMLGRYAQSVVLCYDSDNAGVAAAERAIEVLREAKIKTKVLQMDGAKDPDELVNKKGVEFFKKLVVDAKSALEYKIQRLSEQYNVEIVDEKVEFLQKIAELFAKVENPVEREAYITKISADVGISADSIMAEIRRLKFQNDRAEESRATAAATRISERNMRDAGERVTPKNKKVVAAEKLLLNLMCERRIFSMAANRITADDFSVLLHKEIALHIYDTYKQGKKLDVHEVAAKFENHPAVIEILLDDKNVENFELAATEAIDVILNDAFLRKKEELLASGNSEKLFELMSTRQRRNENGSY